MENLEWTGQKYLINHTSASSISLFCRMIMLICKSQISETIDAITFIKVESHHLILQQYLIQPDY